MKAGKLTIPRTDPFPTRPLSVFARVMPNGSTAYQYFERLTNGLPTKFVEKWAGAMSMAPSTRIFRYAVGLHEFFLGWFSSPPAFWPGVHLFRQGRYGPGDRGGDCIVLLPAVRQKATGNRRGRNSAKFSLPQPEFIPETDAENGAGRRPADTPRPERQPEDVPRSASTDRTAHSVEGVARGRAACAGYPTVDGVCAAADKGFPGRRADATFRPPL